MTATLDRFHLANRHHVVADMAAFLLQYHATAGTYVETVEAALAYAAGLDGAEWFALGILTGHYRHGAAPDQETSAGVLTHLERLLPVTHTSDELAAAFKGLGA